MPHEVYVDVDVCVSIQFCTDIHICIYIYTNLIMFAFKHLCAMWMCAVRVLK